VTPLRQRMLEDLQIRHYSPTTIRLYLYAVREFAKHFGKPPDQLGAEHIRRYQLFLTKEKKARPRNLWVRIRGTDATCGRSSRRNAVARLSHCGWPGRPVRGWTA